MNLSDNFKAWRKRSWRDASKYSPSLAGLSGIMTVGAFLHGLLGLSELHFTPDAAWVAAVRAAWA